MTRRLVKGITPRPEPKVVFDDFELCPACREYSYLRGVSCKRLGRCRRVHAKQIHDISDLPSKPENCTKCKYLVQLNIDTLHICVFHMLEVPNPHKKLCASFDEDGLIHGD